MTKLYFFFLILAIILLFNIPTDYSQPLCIGFFVMYILLAYFYLLRVNRFGLCSFDLFFLIGILLTCFIYPAFFVDIEIFRAFNNIDNKLINKATLISLAGSISYMVGSLYIFKDEKDIVVHRKPLNIVVLRNAFYTSLFLSCLLIIVFLSVGGLNYIFAYDSNKTIDLSSSLEVLDLFKIVFLVLSVLIFIISSRYNHTTLFSLILKFNVIYTVLFFFVIILLLAGGTRNLPIQFILMVFGLYNLIINKISKKNVFLLILFGFVFFTFIRISRDNLGSNQTTFSTGFNASNNFNVIDLISDLLVSSAPLYTLIGDADNYGLKYGKPMLLPILSAIPFAQNVAIEALDLNTKELEPTSMIATDLIYNSFESGAGTNIIGDLYYSFGIPGVIIFMCLLGSIISYLGNNIMSTSNIYSLLAYIAFFSISFFFVRVEYLYSVRYLTWSLFLMKLIT